MSQVLDDLVTGELQQLGGLDMFPSESGRARDRVMPSLDRLVALSSPAIAARDAPGTPLERALAHCLCKTYRKTASLIANFARAVRRCLMIMTFFFFHLYWTGFDGTGLASRSSRMSSFFVCFARIYIGCCCCVLLYSYVSDSLAKCAEVFENLRRMCAFRTKTTQTQ